LTAARFASPAGVQYLAPLNGVKVPPRIFNPAAWAWSMICS